jgi:hypothetical protein
MKGRVVPRKWDGRRPGKDAKEGTEKGWQQCVLEVVRSLPETDAKTFVENLQEWMVQPVHKIISRLITMQLGGWQPRETHLVHEGGLKLESKGYTVDAVGKLVTNSGKPFFFCDSEKLHSIRESLEGTLKLLDDERKLDLFVGVKDLVHGREGRQGKGS